MKTTCLIFLMSISLCRTGIAQRPAPPIERHKESATALRHRWEEEMAVHWGDRILGIRKVLIEGKPYVEIKLRSNGIFEVRNSPYVLHIGCHSFSLGNVSLGGAESDDDFLHTMTSLLTPAEYQQINSGDRVYIDGMFFGVLHKRRISLPASESRDCPTQTGTMTVARGLQKPDFSLQVSGEQKLLVSGKADYSVTVTPMGRYKGTVALSMVAIAPEGFVPEGITGSFEPPQITGSGKSTLHIWSREKWLQPHKFYLSIEGKDKNTRIDHITGTLLTIYTGPPDFSITTTEGRLSVLRGSEASSAVTIKSINGFQAILPLSVSGLPQGIKASVVPDRALVLEDSGDSYLTVVVGDKVPPGDYELTITGVAQTRHGPLKRDTQVGLTVYASDFSLSAKPESLDVVAGEAVSCTTTLALIKGDEGSVSFGIGGLPWGANASFRPASVRPQGTPPPSQLTISTKYWTPAGSYPLQVMAASKHRSPMRSTRVMLVVHPPQADFALTTSTPNTPTVQAGGGTAYTLALDSIGGYQGMISLSVSGLPSGAKASFSSDSVDLKAGRSPFASPNSVSVLTLFTDNSTPPGAYKLTVTGTAKNAKEPVTHSLSLDLIIAAASDSR
ncbi:MAG TPA: hypothetical protein VK738_11565 [Terriglobales bacterium]|jgi:hypothetical protein|nr:hypothetical protein [Terriglobales bacterium]